MDESVKNKFPALSKDILPTSSCPELGDGAGEALGSV
jgi:hypothetical protein